MSIFNLQRFAYNIQRFIECFLQYNLAYFCPYLVLMHEPTVYKLQHAYKVYNFSIKTIRYSCVLGDKHKFIGDVADKDHKITILLHIITI